MKKDVSCVVSFETLKQTKKIKLKKRIFHLNLKTKTWFKKIKWMFKLLSLKAKIFLPPGDFQTVHLMQQFDTENTHLMYYIS